MRKAIFFDIDGTLIDCVNGLTDMTPKVKEAIRSLQDKGHYIFISTGRPYAFLSQAILDFGFDGFILTNGAQVMMGNETIYKEPLDREFVKTAVEQFEAFNIQYMLQGERYSYMKHSHQEFYALFEQLGISKRYLKGDYHLEDIETQKIEMLCPDDAAVEFCLSLINNNPDYDHFHSLHEKSFELYAKKNTKATAILTTLKHLGIPVENSYAFGDGKNDIEMLSTVGCGIAMGNASDEVKQYAKEITESVHHDGVAVGIEKYVLCSC